MPIILILAASALQAAAELRDTTVEVYGYTHSIARAGFNNCFLTRDGVRESSLKVCKKDFVRLENALKNSGLDFE